MSRVKEIDVEHCSTDDETETASSATSQSTISGTSSRSRKGRRRKAPPPKPLYKHDSHWKEDHGTIIYGVAFNHFLLSTKLPTFSTVGSNRCTVYECPSKSGVNLLLCYADPNVDECFYTCVWTYSTVTLDPLLAVAGQLGIIRIIDVLQHKSICNFVGHGGAINQIKIHPMDPRLLLSCSKDYAVRLWNISTQVLIAVFSGVDGHRAEVLTIDFDLRGQRIMSGGLDHALKMWKITGKDFEERIKESMKFKRNVRKPGKQFPSIIQHNPDFSSREIHGNYVDCVQWFGEFIISKSCQNEITVWKIGSLNTNQQEDKKNDKDIESEIIVQFKCKYSELWFLRFDFNIWQRVLAVGNQMGKIYVWEFSKEGPKETNAYTLSNKECKTTIRDVTFSKDAKILIAVCDDSTVWRWNKI